MIRRRAKFREYTYIRDVTAGCHECDGYVIKWQGKNAQGVAARHHDATGHHTWAEIDLSIYYGGLPGKEAKDNANVS